MQRRIKPFLTSAMKKAATFPARRSKFPARLDKFPVPRNKFPVSFCRELSCNKLILLRSYGQFFAKRPDFRKIPCFFPVSREFEGGDQFAADCVVSQRVPSLGCYFPVGGESPTVPRVRSACPGLWPTISGISVRAGQVSGAGLCSPFFNFHFGGAETGSTEHIARWPSRVRTVSGSARSPFP
jgi:hypothetical protein